MTFQPSDYQPRFNGGHLQTLFAWARRRHFPRLPEPEPRYFDVTPDARVVAAALLTFVSLLLVHGLTD